MSDVIQEDEKYSGFLDFIQTLIYIVFIGISIVMSLITIVLAVGWVVMAFIT